MLYLSSGDEQSQKVFGIYVNLGEAGMVVAAGVYSLFIRDNYRLSGLLTVFSYTAAFVLAFFLKEVKAPAAQREKGAFKEFFRILKRIIKDKYVFLMLIGIALFSEVHQTVTVFLNQLQYTRSGIADGYMGYIYIAVVLIGMLGVFSAKLTTRIGEKTFAIIIFAVTAASCMVMSFTHVAVISIAGIALLRLGASMLGPLYMKQQNEIVVSGDRATELSVYMVITDCIGVGTNVVFGKIAQISLPVSLMAGAVFIVVGAALYFVWYGHSHTN